jgi:pyrroloquinoline quinone (PQQ) biosynthesis protein C
MTTTTISNQEKTMQFYDLLRSQTEVSRKYLLDAPVIQQVLDRDFSLATYIVFLNQAYHHVKHTIPLLMAAGGRLDEEHAWLREAISDYIDEEIGHEQWILNDIEACGYNREQFASGDAPFTSEILVAYLYDCIARRNPLGIFGMVLVLEETSSSLAPMVAEIVQDKLSLPDSAMTYLVTHGELDQDHIRFFEKTMNKITCPTDQKAIVDTANVIYRLYGDVYYSLPQAAADIPVNQAA